jgi:hypothetical protein
MVPAASGVDDNLSAILLFLRSKGKAGSSLGALPWYAFIKQIQGREPVINQSKVVALYAILTIVTGLVVGG